MTRFTAKINKDYSKIPGLQGKTRVLVAPLNWGLGHATRCIPIIQELIDQGAEPVIGGSGQSGALLKAEFPTLEYHEIPSAEIRYSRSRHFFALQLIRQLPALNRQVKAENNWLKTLVTANKIDAVIADNRYGLYHPAIPAVIISHQLHIKSGMGRLADRLLQLKNYRQLSKFNSCWIPDNETGGGLAGELSHPEKMPHIPCRYTGPLTRFSASAVEEEKNHLLILLSGPEPQRTILEEKILETLHQYRGTVTMVRGLPDHERLLPSTSQIRIYNHLPADELNNEIGRAGYIISRTGYTTLMDLFPFRKKTILIPTPGQPEQEYLGRYHGQQQHALIIPQKEFSFVPAIEQAKTFNYRFPVTATANSLPELVSEFLQQLH